MYLVNERGSNQRAAGRMNELGQNMCRNVDGTCADNFQVNSPAFLFRRPREN